MAILPVPETLHPTTDWPPASPLQEVVERRKEVSRYMQDPVYKKKIDEEKRARFKAKKEQEERDNPVPK